MNRALIAGHLIEVRERQAAGHEIVIPPRVGPVPVERTHKESCMKSFRKVGACLLVAMIASGLGLDTQARPAPQAKTDAKVVAKLALILEQSGYSYTKAAENVWVVKFKGKSLLEFSVFVASAEDLVVIGAVVAPKKSMNVTPEMMFKLLRLVHSIDRVKIGFDDDEDLFVRCEVAARTLDLDAFKADIEQVAAGTDQVHAAITAYLVN
jgi:hypothetical protein